MAASITRKTGKLNPMTRYVFFTNLAERNGIDISEILYLEKKYIERNGKKPNRTQMSHLCFAYSERGQANDQTNDCGFPADGLHWQDNQINRRVSGE